MRIDHHAYQRATGVAAAGLFAQLAIALLLLVFGKSTDDTTAIVASIWAFTGLVVWLGLILLFHQQRLERLESLEMDAGARLDDGGRLFTADEARVARKRLGLMHAALMPALSVLYALLLVGFAAGINWWMGKEGDPNADYGNFTTSSALGWQLAVAFGASLLSFIFSRFLAGMAVQKAWGNLRGGAGVMVGNALVTLALGVGSVFEILRDESAGQDAFSQGLMKGIVWGVAAFMVVVAAETLLNFVLNLYRPRRAGETPRPAFDSRILSLFAAPDSIVRSINEAVNYQFGFDITSSWGYQLLLRNFVRLLAIGVVVVVGLTALVIVEPQEQGMRLRFGAPVGEVYQGAPMLKLPWPIDTAIVEDVNRVRELPLGVIKDTRALGVIVWGEDVPEVDLNVNLFLVGAGARSASLTGQGDGAGTAGAQATDQFAVVEADIVLQYRVRNQALDRYLAFTNDVRSRRSQLGMRERALKAIALREVTRELSRRSLDEVLSPPVDKPLVDVLAQAIQGAYDAADCGVEVVGVSIPRLRPPGKEGGKFEELSIARQNGRRELEDAQSTISTNMSLIVGDVARADEVFKGIGELTRLEQAAKTDPAARAAADALRARLEQLVLDSRAQAASVISSARAMRWNALMDAQSIAQDVLGQAPAWQVDPELYRTRRTMEALGEALAGVRVKYVLLPDAQSVRLDIEMQEPTTGLNLADYLEKKDGGGGG
jgi:regulator of protease activity HflC (stomatin/prohibitin superfamily)